MTEIYSELTLVDIQNNTFAIRNVFKDMTVDRFKRAVGIKAGLPQASWENLQLHVGETELDDQLTLESYNLEDQSRIHFVSSTARPRPRQLAAVPVAQPPPAYTLPSVVSKSFESIMVRSTDDGKTFTFNEIPRDELVQDFSNRVAERLGWPRTDAEFIRLIYGSKQLEASKSI